MSPESQENQVTLDRKPEPSVRLSIRIATVVLALVCLGAVVLLWVRDRPSKVASVSQAPLPKSEPDLMKSAEPEQPNDTLPVPMPDEAVVVAPAGKSSVVVQALTPATPTRPRLEPTPYTRQLINGLCPLDQLGVPQTREQAAQWKQTFQQLIQQGAVAVPAIEEFMDKNLDFGFGAAGSELLGYASARAAMFDALMQIGGPEAVDAMLQTLQKTADPGEIALLARNLDQLAPEQYRGEALSAARQVLGMAADGKLQGTDVGPLFDLFQRFGSVGVTPEMEQAARQWNYYATMALARLPDGAGVPTLIKIAQGSTIAKANAVEMLAQVTARSPEARAALLDLARANKIPPGRWPYLSPLLAGDQYHYKGSAFDSAPTAAPTRPPDTAYVVSGNQHFYTAPGPNSFLPEQMNQQLWFVNDLLSATGEPAAIQALQKSRELLLKRLAQTAAAAPPK